MRSVRILFLAVLAAAGFYLYTTHHPGQPLFTPSWITRPSNLQITNASAATESLDAEEQNNIAVYKRVVPAVVNITSRSVAFDFFYGAVPEEGQGSGFIIDK